MSYMPGDYRSFYIRDPKRRLISVVHRRHVDDFLPFRQF
jgi:hypothetical protein